MEQAIGVEWFDRDEVRLNDLGLNDDPERATIAVSTLTAVIPSALTGVIPGLEFNPAYYNAEISGIRGKHGSIWER